MESILFRAKMKIENFISPSSMLVSVFVALLVVTSFSVYTFSPGRKGVTYEEVNYLWADPAYDWMRVTGPVNTVLLETTELSTDNRTELQRRPLLKFQYDQAGRLLKEIGYRDDGHLLPPTIYMYDIHNKLSKAIHYNAYSSTSNITTYTYNSEGRLIETIKYDADDNSVLSKKVYIHDPKRSYTEVTEYWGDALRTKIGYFRNDHGRIVEQHQLSTLAQGKASIANAGKVLFTYDAKGDVIQEQSNDADGKLESKKNISYEYDSYGNWIKRTTTTEYFNEGKFSKPIHDITYRTITYYQ